MGTVYGSWEELPAYAIVILPLFISAGYDAITGMMVILIGANIGNMASVVNPLLNRSCGSGNRKPGIISRLRYPAQTCTFRSDAYHGHTLCHKIRKQG